MSQSKSADLVLRMNAIAQKCGYADSMRLFNHLVHLGWKRGWIAQVFGIRQDVLSTKFVRSNPRYSREQLVKLAKAMRDIKV